MPYPYWSKPYSKLKPIAVEGDSGVAHHRELISGVSESEATTPVGLATETPTLLQRIAGRRHLVAGPVDSVNVLATLGSPPTLVLAAIAAAGGASTSSTIEQAHRRRYSTDDTHDYKGDHVSMLMLVFTDLH